jgi:Flp pilus assembly pilin Flp
MHDLYVKLQFKLWLLLESDEGQDLVEYGLIVTAIALAAIGGVQNFATAVVHLFSNIDSSLASLQAIIFLL